MWFVIVQCDIVVLNVIYSLLNNVTFHVCDKLFINNNKIEGHMYAFIKLNCVNEKITEKFPASHV